MKRGKGAQGNIARMSLDKESAGLDIVGTEIFLRILRAFLMNCIV